MTCDLAGTWMGVPSNGFYAMIFTITASGETYTANVVGWYATAFQGQYDQVQYTLTGTVSGNNFSLQSTPSSNPLTFNGSCAGPNAIGGTLQGEFWPGTSGTATIGCVLLGTVYPNTVVGQWSGATGAQSASLSLLQSGNSITAGVGTVGFTYQGTAYSFDVTVSGTVDYPNFSMTLSSTNKRTGVNVSFSGSATNPTTLSGTLESVGPLTLTLTSVMSVAHEASPPRQGDAVEQ